MNTKEYSILVNTCDKFEDCWNPFFQLFKTYWPNCGGKLFLNTEYKDYSYEGLEITAIKGCESHNVPRSKRETWSRCLRYALEAIPDDIVLYLQEDYFLKAPVSNDIVEKYVGIMLDNPKIKCIYISNPSTWHDEPSQYDNLYYVKRYQRYRVSCQAAIWRKDELLRLIRDYESAWEFEEFGSKRSSKMNNLYLGVPRSYVFDGFFEIIPYIYTGIVQGRWFEPTKPLFESHGIKMDYSRRGFLSDTPKERFGDKLKRRLKRLWPVLRGNLELKLS